MHSMQHVRVAVVVEVPDRDAPARVRAPQRLAALRRATFVNARPSFWNRNGGSRKLTPGHTFETGANGWPEARKRSIKPSLSTSRKRAPKTLVLNVGIDRPSALPRSAKRIPPAFACRNVP